MLFKFTASDICDTSFVDCASGAVAYRTVTSRTRSGPGSTLRSLSSLSALSKSVADLRASADEPEKITFIQDGEGKVQAEITWEGSYASSIKIGDEVIQGTAELFDSAFIKIYPDETLLPTRMEYTWRTTPENLTLLDDDNEVIGKVHPKCVMTNGNLVPARSSEEGHDYFQLDSVFDDEVLELIVCCLLVKQLHERLYTVRNYIPQRRDPLAKFRRGASRSLATLRDTLRRAAE